MSILNTPASNPGELEIRSVLPMDPAARKRLAGLIKSSEEAKVMLAEMQSLLPAADSKPDPLEVIEYEGKLNTDPARIETVRHLQDLERLAAWFEVWQATEDPALSEKCRVYIVVWADTYIPNGNDVNENKLLPLLVAYESLRPEFSVTERTKIDDWVRKLATPHLTAVRNTQNASGNRFAKRLRIVAVASMILDEPGWMTECVAALRILVQNALYADGTSHDLLERDTLTYHTTTLRPLIEVALLERSEDLYTWTAPGGGSIQKSINYLLPYANGLKIHEEWVHSRSEIDKKRAAAGIEHYQPGRRYDPKQAIRVLEEAEFFDPGLRQLVAVLVDRPGSQFPTWRILLNSALRE